MPALLQRMPFSANDVDDMVQIRLGAIRPLMPYGAALELAAHLRVACKEAMPFYAAPPRSWRDLDTEDLDDCPRPHRGFRRSTRVPNYRAWSCHARRAPLITVVFDGVETDLDLEFAIRIHVSIRRAGRRAKAWAGDRSKTLRITARLSDANAA